MSKLDRSLPMIIEVDICDDCTDKEQCMDRDCYLSQYSVCCLSNTPTFLSEEDIGKVGLIIME